MPERHEVVITGIGIVSCLGEGPDAHWQALSQGKILADTTTNAPYVVHPIVALDLDKQIPKKGDQRQMEAWQRIGTYAAGLALDSAGIKGDAAQLATMDMIVSAGGGERDLAVDSKILTDIAKAPNPDGMLNERLMGELRPTLFLAQLSNLLAGNISIVHGVTGSSRTFMGEESSGVDAVRIAHARIAAGQSELALVGGSHNGERKDLLLLHALGDFALKGDSKPVWERENNHGFALGSMGAFLVLESRAHAQARGAKVIARLADVVAERSDRKNGSAKAALQKLWSGIASKLRSGAHAVISGATGAWPVTGEERDFLAAQPALAVRATATYIGHGMEAQFPMNVALAAIAVDHGEMFAPSSGSDIERATTGTTTQVVVTSLGHWRGEGLALVEAAG
jgi:3-oxoacyl-[acyl-carrier-protein] synthase II